MRMPFQAHIRTPHAKPGDFLKPAFPKNTPDPHHPILQLQRMLGNQALQYYLQPQSRPVNTNTKALASNAIQAKLTVSTPGDAYEQEAERIAGAITQTPAIEPHLTRAHDGGTPTIQAKHSVTRTNANAIAPPFVRKILDTPGQALDPATRRFMESRLGHDLSAVRVHTGRDAADSAQSVDALAYTLGHNIVFGRHQYAPHTAIGRRLLAHELVHVIQQGHGAAPHIQRQAPPAAQPFDWGSAVRQAEGLAANTNTRAQAEPIYKDLIVRAAATVAAPAPLVNRNPTAADIRWSWDVNPQLPHGAEAEGARVDNDPNDYWKWMKFMPGSVKASGPQPTEGTLRHELDHAAHAKALFESWRAAGSPGNDWNAYWLAHVNRWAEPALQTQGGTLKAIAGLPASITPSLIELRAYTAQLVANFHRVERSRQGYLARAVVLFYPLHKQAVAGQPAAVNDPDLDLGKIKRRLMAYYLNGDPNQREVVRTLFVYEMKSALTLRPAQDVAQLERELPMIFGKEISAEDLQAAKDKYVPSP